MKASKRKAHAGMVYYLKKFWGANFLAILPALAACALQTGTRRRYSLLGANHWA